MVVRSSVKSVESYRKQIYLYESYSDVDSVTDRSGVYKLFKVRMFEKELTNLRMKGSITGRYRNVSDSTTISGNECL